MEINKSNLNEWQCQKCKFLSQLYKRTPQAPRDYWLMTELFVMLHGSDECDKKAMLIPLCLRKANE